MNTRTSRSLYGQLLPKTGTRASAAFPRTPVQKRAVSLLAVSGVLACLWTSPAMAAAFDAAPLGLSLPEGNGVRWEDPREIHRVVVQFQGTPPDANRVRLEYWGSWWPERHLPKNREPGGGDIGWLELGNWYRGGSASGSTRTAACFSVPTITS
jgi:hypothetical protein